MAVIMANPSSTAEFLEPTEGIKASSLAGAPLGDSIKNFLEVAMQIAQIDEAITGARASAPSQEDTEASKWHEVSIKALMWTRSSVAEQQSIALGQLKNVVVSQRSSALPSPSVIGNAIVFYVRDSIAFHSIKTKSGCYGEVV